MARFKEELSWLTINPETLPAALQTKHQAIRDLFATLKVAKESFEKDCDAVLVKLAKAMPEEAKAVLKISADGKFPTGSVRKFSYMRGIAVATASAPKGKAASGLALS